MIKPIEGYEGRYEISDMGEVFSCDRIERGKNNTPRRIKRKKRALREHLGYMEVTFIREKKSETLKVHRIVAAAFIPNPENKRCVNHLNGIKSDNRVENLEWCTYQENVDHAKRHGLVNGLNHRVVGINKVSGLMTEFESIADAGRALGVTDVSICRAINVDRFSSAGHYWVY